ncbi:MAG: hypothetical protein ACERKN_22160 [Velocimicrobium sp.]
MKKIINHLEKCIREKDYATLIYESIIFAAVIMILVMVLWFVGQNIEAVLTVGIIGFCFATFFAEQNNKKKKIQKEQLERIHEESVILEEEKANQTYNLLQKELFVCLGELAQILKIKKPQFLSELVAPTRTFKKGEVFFYQFCCLREVENIDTTAFIEVLQQRIDQKLMAGEVYGIGQPFYIYEGQIYSLIKVVDIENVGVNLYITLTVINEAFCKNERMRKLAKQQAERNQIGVRGDCNF